MILQSTNVIEIGGTGIGPQVFTSLLFIIYSFSLNYRESVNAKYLFIYFLYSILLMYMYLTSPNNFLVIGQLGIYTLCAYRLYKLRSILSEIEYSDFIYKMSKFFVLFCFVQLLCSINILPKFILKDIFFNEDSPLVQFNKPYSYFRVCGTFMESSYCATFVVGLIAFIFSQFDRRKHLKILLGLGIILLLTLSSTGYAGMLLLLIVYFMMNINLKTITLFIPLLMILSVIFWFTKDNILQEVLFNKLDSDSGVERNGWNEMALEAYDSNRLTGVGLGNARASSFALCLLAETGLIGTIIYLLYLLAILLPMARKDRLNLNEISSRYFFLGVIICMIIACPDQTLSSLWFGLYLISLSSK